MSNPNAANGNNGRLELVRTWPEPIVLASGSVSLPDSTILVRDPAYWSGDRVWLAAAKGLPFADLEDDLGLVITSCLACYIHQNELDEVSFYLTLQDALEGLPEKRLIMDSAAFGRLVMAPYGPGTSYMEGAIEAAAGVQDLCVEEDDQENRLSELMPLPAAFTQVQTPATSEWFLLGDVEKWSMAQEAPGLPSKGLGESADDKTKDSTSGSGEITFLVRYSQQHRSYPALIAMRLTEMLERSCTVSARLYLVKNDTTGHAFWKEGRLMFERHAIDSTAAELLRISASFSVIGTMRPRLAGVPTLCA